MINQTKNVIYRMSKIKQFLVLVIYLITCCCGNKQNSEKIDNYTISKTFKTKPIEIIESSFKEDSITIILTENLDSSHYDRDHHLKLISGERIKGRAVLRDKPGGKAMFILEDNALINCTNPKDEWYEIGFIFPMTKYEFTLMPGRKIENFGYIVNETDLRSVIEAGGNYYGSLTGFTHKENIRKETIIENVLEKYLLENNTPKNIKSYLDFIEHFDFDSTYFKGYLLLMYHENWIDDPSPNFRVCLAFKNDSLVAIGHSRNLKISGTNKYFLENNRVGQVFKNNKNESEIVKILNTLSHD